MTTARETQISLETTPYYHCVARCVRRAFLCGKDEFSGRSFEHRKDWIVDRIKEISSAFAVDVCAYAVMSNHYHVVLRVDADAANAWTGQEVIERWGRVFSVPAVAGIYADGGAVGPMQREAVSGYVEQFRARLCDISWFMRCINEHIARKANREDRCKGRFWEGRFRSQALLDESAVIACMAYVDLNPIRAGMAETPEESQYTSIRERLLAFAQRKRGRPRKTQATQPATLTSLSERENLDNHQAIPFDLEDYLQLVDITGRIIRSDKRGAIPPDLAPILQRLGVDEAHWVDNVQHFGRRFHRFVGRVERLKSLSHELGHRWLHGLTASAGFYRRVAPSA